MNYSYITKLTDKQYQLAQHFVKINKQVIDIKAYFEKAYKI